MDLDLDNSTKYLYLTHQVLLEDEAVSTRKVLLTVLSKDRVKHNVKYVITKQGGNITLDCTDFEGEDVNWIRLGGGTLLSLT